MCQAKACRKSGKRNQLTKKRGSDSRAKLAHGGLVLIGKAAVLKTAGFCPWGFESLILRQYILCDPIRGEVTELAEGARLLSVCGSKAHPGFESLPLRHIFVTMNIDWAVAKR